MRKTNPAATPLTADWAEEAVSSLPALVTVEEAFTFLRCSLRTLHRAIRAGRLVMVQRERGARIYIPRTAIASYLRSMQGAA